jgi:hypothetical protein
MKVNDYTRYGLLLPPEEHTRSLIARKYMASEKRCSNVECGRTFASIIGVVDLIYRDSSVPWWGAKLWLKKARWTTSLSPFASPLQAETPVSRDYGFICIESL